MASQLGRSVAQQRQGVAASKVRVVLRVRPRLPHESTDECVMLQADGAGASIVNPKNETELLHYAYGTPSVTGHHRRPF